MFVTAFLGFIYCLWLSLVQVLIFVVFNGVSYNSVSGFSTLFLNRFILLLMVKFGTSIKFRCVQQCF
jgi:hypothetical protein